MTCPAADANALRGLESRVNAAVSGVRSQPEDLARDAEGLQPKAGDTEDLGYTLRRLEDSIEDLEVTAGRLEAELDEHTSDTGHALEKLTARVRLPENLAPPCRGLARRRPGHHRRGLEGAGRHRPARHRRSPSSPTPPADHSAWAVASPDSTDTYLQHALRRWRAAPRGSAETGPGIGCGRPG